MTEEEREEKLTERGPGCGCPCCYVAEDRIKRVRASNAELLEVLEGLYTTFQQSNDFRPDSKIARQARAAFARAAGQS